MAEQTQKKEINEAAKKIYKELRKDKKGSRYFSERRCIKLKEKDIRENKKPNCYTCHDERCKNSN